MNKESNSYTLIYASVMVILVAFILAFTSQALRPQQSKNEAVDKMRQILSAINIESTNSNADAQYNKYITDQFLVNIKGERVEGDAFSTELVDELRKPAGQRQYPVFVAQIDGKPVYILSLRGAGLWGPLWGYIALEDDKNTIYGAGFGHQGETPGLGAEIDKQPFSKQFIGKKIFNPQGRFTSVAIVKPGQAAQGQDYVDGISGGTITSQGVDAMLKTSLQAYEPFLISK
jgi:NADH:ubiquinone oxidoreductase, Na(+)-translocating, C subunit